MTTWNIDSSHSGIHFTARHMVFAKVRGAFKAFRGTVTLPDDAIGKGSVEATIEAASIDTGTAQRDAHLRSADFFDVERFPSLSFTSKRVEPKGKDAFLVVGDLTIRDVTREVALEAKSLGRGKDPWGNQRLGFTASASIDRKDFGLTWNQALEAGGVLVGDAIEIELEVQAVEAKAEKVA